MRGIWVEIQPRCVGLEGDFMLGQCEFRDITAEEWRQ